MEDHTKTSHDAPPPGTRWILSRRDLPSTRLPCSYVIVTGQTQRPTIIQKTYRQVLEALRRGPIYCASPVRLSDVVYVLKREHGVDIETLFYQGDDGQRFGVYVLRSHILSTGDVPREVAA